MSNHKIIYYNLEWRSAEALFQAMRFDIKDPIREEIREQKSPMAAKMVAKSNSDKMIIKPLSNDDIDNMRLVIRLKVNQHPELRQELIDTGDAEIIEDCTKRRASQWGAQLIDEQWIGNNILGKLWMELRSTYSNIAL